MSSKKPQRVTARFDVIVGGGQSLATLEDGRKLFAWGVLPGETAEVLITKKKSRYLEGVAETILESNQEVRVAPVDPESYLSTSPWQIMNFESEQHYKAALIEEAFELHDVVLPDPIEVYSDGKEYGYRNKIEFSFWYDTEAAENPLSLAFFRRGTHGKIAVNGTSLASPAIAATAERVLAVLNSLSVEGRALKTLMIRSAANGDVAWQLYVKDEAFPAEAVLAALPESENGEVIYSNPKSPASVITERLTAPARALSDTILGTPFTYATEGFFQINLPIYEQALRDMQAWVPEGIETVDMYSGVGTIGLTIGGDSTTLVEVNEYAVGEMRRNIKSLGLKAEAVLAASENALDYITGDKTIIVDPPRAGLHEAVIERLLSEAPKRIVYLSCNPVTQARDVARLGEKYGIKAHKGYNFFPRTPHIEHLVVLDLKG
ncbi:class I SAM-dependent RNA methyltransferase [Candidatus Saccharibacteria bacterium TM7i]|nr:class I SAM-dependent RNA methyltransferase [Candidatus Saccharibacteria bacterium TM7i]